jgi:hypothetical protein
MFEQELTTILLNTKLKPDVMAIAGLARYGLSAND